jgi:hypothetical protein
MAMDRAPQCNFVITAEARGALFEMIGERKKRYGGFISELILQEAARRQARQEERIRITREMLACVDGSRCE